MSSKHLWIKDSPVLSVFNEGRHYDIDPFIFTMQYAMGLNPEYRNQFDFVFLLSEDFESSRRKLYEHYGGIFPTFEQFNQIFEQITENYGCMVINNRVKSNVLEEKISWYKIQ